MTLSADARAAVRDHPFLFEALRAGVVNYSAAARFLDLDGDPAAVAAALRRYADAIEADDPAVGDARVTMERESTAGDLPDPDAGERAIVATGTVGPHALSRAIDRLRIEGIPITAAGAADGHIAVIVERRESAHAVRSVEAVLDT